MTKKILCRSMIYIIPMIMVVLLLLNFQRTCPLQCFVGKCEGTEAVRRVPTKSSTVESVETAESIESISSTKLITSAAMKMNHQSPPVKVTKVTQKSTSKLPPTIKSSTTTTSTTTTKKTTRSTTTITTTTAATTTTTTTSTTARSKLSNLDPQTKQQQVLTQQYQRKEKKKCKPVKNVIFLKTHKTGSSTIINIMQRYSDRHNLTIALPVGVIFLGWPQPFNETKIYQYSNGSKYNIICNHARFSKEKMLNLMTDRENTKIVTILRDPLTQLESGAVYFNYTRMFGLPYNNHFIDEFFKDVDERTKVMSTKKDGVYSLVKNPNAFDMGHSIWNDDPGNVTMVLENAKRDFDLVMIAEKMDESLILLKEELCWDLEDVAYFTKNKRPNKIRQKINNIKKAREHIKEWSKIDYTLYKHFNKTIHEKIQKGGQEFRDEVDKLRRLNKELDERCLNHSESYEKSQPVLIYKLELNKQVVGTKDQELCEEMITNETTYTKRLLDRLAEKSRKEKQRKKQAAKKKKGSKRENKTKKQETNKLNAKPKKQQNVEQQNQNKTMTKKMTK